MSASDAMVLDVQHVVAGYGDERVLDDVSLTVERGEIVVVLGGSGSGKSTLLRCVVGLLAPWAGRVLVGGKDVNAAEGRERDAILRDVGMSFQSAALLNSMTVAENVALPIVEHLDVDERTAYMLARMRLARVGLAGAGDKMPNELSGGMRKRAGLARAMALEPSLLLCDEPSAGLDPVTGRELDDVILDLKHDGSMGIVVVSHELGSINTIADRAIMLADGRVLASGTLAAVRAHPDPRVQAFFKREALAAHDHTDLLAALERPA
jgi:phospholipid/cholesterol/gamma-HCH transport system ATP-binding protein